MASRASNWTFRIGITPSPAHIAKMFGEAAAEFADYKPALYRVAPKILAGIKRAYDSKGASLGEEWPGLSDKNYLARKSRLGWSRAEMYATHRLAQSIGLIGVTKKSVKVGTSEKKAKALQWGRKGQKKGRMFIALDDKSREESIEELNAYSALILQRLAGKIGVAP